MLGHREHPFPVEKALRFCGRPDASLSVALPGLPVIDELDTMFDPVFRLRDLLVESAMRAARHDG